MRQLLLTSTLLAAASAAQAQTITPGQGTLTDASGNRYQITSDGAILEDGSIWVAGGGGTAELTVNNGALYGLDATGKGWFRFSSGSGDWASVPASAVGSAALTAAAVVVNTAARASNLAPIAATSVPATAASPTMPVQVCSTQPSGGTGKFSVQSGQIIGPNGQPFIARGMNVLDSQMGDASAIVAMFPGINFIRLNVLSYQPSGAYAAFIQTMTSAGRVVELEDHTNSTGLNAGGATGVVYSGAQLAAELNWYSSVAGAYAGNTYVWFGTDNEPATSPSVAALDQWQLQTYQAIRGAGNNSIVMLEIWGYPGAWMGGIVAADYAGMTNTIWDDHFYGWVAGYSTVQTTVNQALSSMISATQASATSADGIMPVLIGEYGNSTSGTSLDPNGKQVVEAVINLGADGQNGSAAWAWNAYGVVGMDQVVDFSQSPPAMTSPYGQSVQLFLNTSVVPLTACQATAAAETAINAVTAQVAQAAANPPANTAPAGGAATGATAAEDPMNTQAAQMSSGATAAAQAAQAAIANQLPLPAASQ